MAESRKTVTIVFADVSGSTALGEQLDPEATGRRRKEMHDSATAVRAELAEIAALQSAAGSPSL